MSPRNVFDQSGEEPEKFEVPLRMGIGGPVIGTAKIDKDGSVYETEITDEELKRKLQSPPFSMGLPDPADRYRTEDAYSEEWFEQNPDAPRSYREAWERQNPQQ